MPIPKLVVQPTNLYQVNIAKNVEPDLLFISNTSFCAVLKQISSLSDLANNIFEDLTKELSSITERSMRLSKRMKTISEDISLLKKGEEDFNNNSVTNDAHPFISKKPNDSQVLNKNTIPLSMRMYYENAEAPPNVQIMDRLRDDGKISMKMYSDPSFFFDLWSQEMLQAPKVKGKKKKKAKQVGKQPAKSNASNSGYPPKAFLIEQTGLGSGISQPRQLTTQNNDIELKSADHNRFIQSNHQQVLQNNYSPARNNIQAMQTTQNNNQMTINNEFSDQFAHKLSVNQIKDVPMNPYQSMKMPANLISNNLNEQVRENLPPNHLQRMQNVMGQVQSGQKKAPVYKEDSNKCLNEINDLPPPPPAPLLHNPSPYGHFPQTMNNKAQEVKNNQNPVPAPPPPPPPPPQVNFGQVSEESNYPTPPPPITTPIAQENEAMGKPSTGPVPPPPPPPPPGCAIVKTKENTSLQPKKPNACTKAPQGGPPQDLLSAIRAGCNLRKVSQETSVNNGFTTLTRHKDVQSIYDAVIKRRQMMESESDKDGSEDSSEDDWED